MSMNKEIRLRWIFFPRIFQREVFVRLCWSLCTDSEYLQALLIQMMTVRSSGNPGSSL